MKNLTWQNPEQLFVAQELINKVKSKCCGIKDYDLYGTSGVNIYPIVLNNGSMSKLNRPIPLSAVGAGFACPKTQNKLFSGEQTSPLRIK